MAAEKEYETLKGEVEQLRTDISSISHTLKEMVRNQGAESYGRVRQSADKIQEEVRHSAESVSHQIKERPLTSLVSAFGLGMIIAILFARR